MPTGVDLAIFPVKSGENTVFGANRMAIKCQTAPTVSRLSRLLVYIIVNDFVAFLVDFDALFPIFMPNGVDCAVFPGQNSRKCHFLPKPNQNEPESGTSGF